MYPQPAISTSWTMAVPDLLTLDPVGHGRYRSHVNQDNFQAAIFGGQLLGQALMAATGDIAGTGASKRIHSLHGYFLEAGRGDLPLDYVVETMRDSPSSALLHVIAIQDDRRLFDMHCFFRISHAGGFDHQVPPPVATMPEQLESLADIARADPALLGEFGSFILDGAAIEVKPQSRGDLHHEPGETRRCFWFRVPSAAMVEDDALHYAMLAYLSDYWFARVALVPHISPVPRRDMKFVSIDHGMWFHRPVRVDDWLLYDTESPSASDGTGFARGLIYDRAGRLAASTVQEVLQMPRRAKTPTP